MLVASGAEHGNECEAAVALPPQVVGHIETAIGCGTLTHGSGIAIQAVAGDPVCRGDVIETAADGRIGIRFTDGTAFNISCDTRVVLSEFHRDSSGTPHSALLGVKGTSAFIAGQVAKTVSLAADTPVGSIRGRAHTGGFGMLSLTALTFSMMKEVQAADSNVTFLDDDSITYRDREHGAFELITKEPIPRHIIVEDPGETVVLRRIGSSVSVNPVGNTAARMEELQAAQQDVLANYAKGLGRTGSGTTPFGEPLPVQPINFIETDAPAPQNSLPPLPSIGAIPTPEITIHPLPTLNGLTGSIDFDSEAVDNFAETSGFFTASSADPNATLTFGISGGTVGSTVLGGVTYDVSKADPHGALYVNSHTGAYVFVPNSAAINALTAPTTDNFVVTVSDGTHTVSQNFTVTIIHTPDAAISGTTAGSVIEAGGVRDAMPGTPTATGTLTDTDDDNPPNTFTAVSSPKASTGGYGTFTMTAAGVWTYTLNDANSTVQALKDDDTLTDTFTVTTIDGTPQVVTITIHGGRDPEIISGTTTGSVTEAGDETPGQPIATGTLTNSDLDNPPNTFTAVSSPKESARGYGSFTMTAAGVWAYTLDEDNCAVQALKAGDTLTDTFTVTTIDGTPQLVTVTIHGADHEDPDDFDHVATGTLAISDPQHVSGTPKVDTIAGGGDGGQVIHAGAGADTSNGTGKSDIAYDAAGHDMMRDKDGDGTIYGDSGRDTINGNDGCGAVVDGCGAHHLTSSNADDRFVFLSVADSRAARFDTTSNFKSGSDRIDLTACGAIAFVLLALTPSSTSVPAHTIAWLYDGTADQTILYVNPTDQTLSIGASDLQEIHLQGSVTIGLSDFDLATTTAAVAGAADPIDPGLGATAQNDAVITATTTTDASSHWTVSDDTRHADGNWAAQVTHVGYGLDADRDQIVWHPERFGDEARMHSTEDIRDEAVIAPASGQQPTGLQHIHLAAPQENKSASDLTTVLDDAAPITTDNGGMVTSSCAIHHRGIATLDADADGGAREATKHGLALEGGDCSSNDEDHGAPISTNVGSMSAATLSAAMHAVFGSAAASALGLEDSFHFKAEISGFEGSGAIDLADVGHNAASIRHHESAAGGHGPEASSAEAHTTEHSPTGQLSADNLPDHTRSADVIHHTYDLMT